MESKQQNRKWIILAIALVLMVLVIVTAVYVCYRLGVFSKPDERPYIDLMPTAGTDATQPGGDGTQGQSGQTEATGGSADPTEDTFVAQPGMIVYDDKQVWTTKTEIELFRIEYENDQEEITVLSDNEEKVIAPGTENSYTFRLKNTGNVSLNYSVMMEAYLSDNVTSIPVEVRMRDFNGFYIIGDEETYAPVLELDGLQDHNTLGAGYYAYYTLEWRWPYEWGDDAYDTYLGNLAVDEPVTLTIEIHTLSSLCDDPNHPGGLLPATGDSFQPLVWVGVSAAALCGIVVLLILGRRKRRKEA